MVRPDLRMPALGLAAWAGGLLALLPAAVVGAAVLLGSAIAWRRRSRTVAAAVLVLGAVATGALLREARVDGDPVAALAAERAVVEAELRVTSDPRPTQGVFGDGVVLRGTVLRVVGRVWRVTCAHPWSCWQGRTGRASRWERECC